MKKNKIMWQFCQDPNDINRAIERPNLNWEGLESAEQIISISYDSHQGCYIVFWRVWREQDE